jgi:CHAD domain-containing protein
MKSAKKYLNSRKVNIDYLLGKPKRSYTPATFHKLRVELKKLNAFLDLINYCSKDFNRSKTYKPFRQVFKQAGKVRELQIQEATLRKYFPKNSLRGYQKNLSTSRLEEKRQFFSMINTKMVNRIRGKFNKIEAFVTKIKSKIAARYLDREIESIKVLLNQSPLQKENLHKLRKRLKTLNYNRAILSLKEYSNQISKKDALPQLLGKWHDMQMMLQHLNIVLISDKIIPNEVTQLGNLKTKISTVSELLFNKIQKALPDSEFFAKNSIIQNPTT